MCASVCVLKPRVLFKKQAQRALSLFIFFFVFFFLPALRLFDRFFRSFCGLRTLFVCGLGLSTIAHTHTHLHTFVPRILGTGFCTPFLFIIIIILVVCYFFDLICRLKGTPAIVYIVGYRVCWAFDGLVRANYAFFDSAQAIEIIIRRQMLQILSTIARHWSRKLKCLFAS